MGILYLIQKIHFFLFFYSLFLSFFSFFFLFFFSSLALFCDTALNRGICYMQFGDFESALLDFTAVIAVEDASAPGKDWVRVYVHVYVHVQTWGVCTCVYMYVYVLVLWTSLR